MKTSLTAEHIAGQLEDAITKIDGWVMQVQQLRLAVHKAPWYYRVLYYFHGYWERDVLDWMLDRAKDRRDTLSVKLDTLVYIVRDRDATLECDFDDLVELYRFGKYYDVSKEGIWSAFPYFRRLSELVEDDDN